jgi:hypothetical protein
MFEWNWDSVAAECTSFLGPAGYGFVQGKVNILAYHESNLTRQCSSLVPRSPSVSPAQEHVQGPEWWTDYQPVSYILTSKRGDRYQYQNMITTCHAAGVKVIAGKSKKKRALSPLFLTRLFFSCMYPDTIWNHMTAQNSGVGVAGSSSWLASFAPPFTYNQFTRLGFTYYDYPNIYNYSDFHHCGLEPGDNIVNYGNAQEVWTCQLSGLAEYV